jgi:DNA-directed RNA polymerase specialized sigma24 family protein
VRDLVVRAREGDRDAFSELAARSLGRLTAVARMILRDEYAAQDTVQDAFIEGWKSLPGGRGGDRRPAGPRDLPTDRGHDRRLRRAPPRDLD